MWTRSTDPNRVEEWFTEDGEARELVVEEVDTGRRVAYSWEEGRVAIEVEEVGDGTRVVVTETGEPGWNALRAALPRVRLRVSEVFDALGDPTRRHIVESLSLGEASATQLAANLPVTRQAVSKHLTALREAGLVESRRQAVRRSTASTRSPSTRRLRGSCAWAVSGTPGWSGCATT